MTNHLHQSSCQVKQSINFTQMVDGTPVESSIPKDIIVEIYKVVGNYRRQ